MLFRRFIEALDSKWSKLGLEYEEKEDKLNITGSISSKTYDDGIYIDATLYDSGNLCMTFVFDQIEPTMKIYDLINSSTTTWVTSRRTFLNADKRNFWLSTTT